MPVACQSRAVTEPQREKARLNQIADKIKSLDFQGFLSLIQSVSAVFAGFLKAPESLLVILARGFVIVVA